MGRKHAFMTLMFVVAGVLAALQQGCAGSPLQQQFLTKASNYLSKAQDIEQRGLRFYNALCAGRESAEECQFISLRAAELNLSLVDVGGLYEDMNAEAKAAKQ